MAKAKPVKKSTKLVKATRVVTVDDYKDRKLNWSPDIPDFRDQEFLPPPRLAVRPLIVDLRRFCSPIEDQGTLGSCTGQAIAGALEFLMFMGRPNLNFFHVSRLFVYYEERVLEGTVNIDAGAYIRDGIKVCQKVGYCHETMWPYIVSRFKQKPPKVAYADAAKYKINNYFRCSTFDQVLIALSQNLPVVFGFSVYNSFFTEVVTKLGKAEMPRVSDKLLGGHAVLAVGYNENERTILCRNSWGTAWGQEGYFTLPYDYVSNPKLAADFWVIRA